MGSNGVVKTPSKECIQYKYGGDGFNPLTQMKFGSRSPLESILNIPDSLKVEVPDVERINHAIQTYYPNIGEHLRVHLLDYFLTKKVSHEALNQNLFKAIRNYFEMSKGTPVGVLAAQNIGEPGNQLALDTKHLTGSSIGPSYDLSRLIQLINATVHISESNCICFIPQGTEEDYLHLKNYLDPVFLSDLLTSYDLENLNSTQDWHSPTHNTQRVFLDSDVVAS